MKRTVVINVVGLTKSLLGEHTPFLKTWSDKRQVRAVHPILPAVTCSVQATYLTGKMPNEHGIVGNGWYFEEECEIKFWRQSNKLIKAKKIWEVMKEQHPHFTCANMFWWFNMYSTADYTITPRPQYHADGIKLPDCYSHPAELRDELQNELGVFPLFDFWGPRTNIKSTKWIADASMKVEEKFSPTLTFIYLPHLDYNFQRHGNDLGKNAKDLMEIDNLCEELIKFYESRNVQVIVLSEYGITSVNRPVHLNRILRKNNYISIREESGLELLDAGASKAFAVVDHQVAHIYLKDKTEAETQKLKNLLQKVEGVELVLDKNDQHKYFINHKDSGTLVCVADKYSWFTYYYWLDDTKAPDFARIVEIHKKPGYDPVELFIDPNINLPMVKVGTTLLKKKLGLRYLMDVISLDGSLVKGSHGRIPESENDWAVLIADQTLLKEKEQIKATDVFHILSRALIN
ncbi:MAG: alkaline phosphatase family protein [Chitinophagales bacterium]|jgi:predicted AlkP superfamily pyrophosphatase or phosphodiesterase|nr:alkaline phosphatase family protein [Chitinophagales bacterium]